MRGGQERCGGEQRRGGWRKRERCRRWLRGASLDEQNLSLINGGDPREIIPGADLVDGRVIGDGDAPQGLTVFDFPENHRRRIRTSNMLERVSQEVKRRTRVIRIFPNQASCLRLVSALLMEISEDWETGRIYLNIDPD